MSKAIVETPYRETTMSTGVTVRVYPVPETLVWRLVPMGKARPEVPMHEMKTKTGTQKRLAKEGDPEWEPYLRVAAAWEERQGQLQEDARLILALREDEDQPDFDWPKKIEPPAYLCLLVEDGELEWPASRTMQRACWLRSVIAPSAEDVARIMDAISVLSGMEEELVDSFRQKLQRELRDKLLGQDTFPDNTLQPVLAQGASGPEGRLD